MNKTAQGIQGEATEGEGKWKDVRHTAQDILMMPEERYIMAGARMSARAAYDYLVRNDWYLKTKKNILHMLRFLAEACPRDQLEAFIYGSHEGMIFKETGKGKNEMEPVKVAVSRTGRPVNPREFLPAEEQRYRELCRVLLDSLESAADMISLMSARGRQEILDQMTAGVNGKSRGRWEVRFFGADGEDGEMMKFEKCREKYFIIVEGEERAAIRESAAAAEKKKRSLEKISGGKKVHVFKAEEKC